MNDRPTAEELLRELSRFLREEAVPALDGPRRFHARVAANVAAMVAREIASEEEDLRAEWVRLAALLRRDPAPPDGREALREAVLDGSRELVRRIRAGEADAGAWRLQLLAHLRRTVDAKLAVARGGR